VSGPGESVEPLEVLLEHLKRERGFDFTGYKRSSLQRRIAKRMEAVGVAGPLEYVEHLELNPTEYDELFDTILINVTTFLRDPAAWRFLQDEILPQMLADIAPEAPIRVWSAGCASGEEAYTLALVLAEALGEDAFNRRVKVYATDVDVGALATARAATYPRKSLDNLPPEWRERYFERVDNRYTFRSDLRRTVIFGRNDLVQDAPISRIDLLVCRNVLMYLNAETQAGVLARFHFALRPTGRLFLGQSEMLITHSQLFTPVSLRERVFVRVGAGSLRERLLSAADTPAPPAPVPAGVRETAFDATPVAQVVFDANGRLALANLEARRLFALHPTDVGRPLQDLELSYRPVELRSLIEQTAKDGRAVEADGLRHRGAGGEERILRARVARLLAENGDESASGVSVTYLDMTSDRALHEELRRAQQDLETAYEELQSTVEELETTNEELRSTNEELETTNEELQSTNEELETMNEELQSTNEELETMNDEMRLRGLELGAVNSFLERMLTALGLAVIVLDADQRVRVWNGPAEDLWGLRPTETEGQHLLGLDFGFPVERLREPLRACLAGRSQREVLQVEAVDRRGRGFICRAIIHAMRSDSGNGTPTGAVVRMEPAEAAA